MQAVVTCMKQILGISLVTVLLLVELSMLPTRSPIIEHYGANRPWMRLPVATHWSRHHSDSHIAQELSWTREGGWVGKAGKIKEREIEAYLRSQAKRAEELHGLRISVRLRVPADAEAGHFIRAAMAAQRAGIPHLIVVVVGGKYS